MTDLDKQLRSLCRRLDSRGRTIFWRFPSLTGSYILFALFHVGTLNRNQRLQLKAVEHAKPSVADAIFNPHFVYLATAVTRRSCLVDQMFRGTHVHHP